MSKLIKDIKSKPLSDQDVLNICDGKANIMTYSDLVKYDNIDDALGPYGALILLYETKKGYGHWVGVIRLNNGEIEHFDPYGLKPDKELKFIPEYYRQLSNQVKPHLTALLYNSGNKVSYNQYKLQKFMKDVNTCGRWVGVRIALKDYDLDDFVKLFKNDNLTPDDLVTLITADI